MHYLSAEFMTAKRLSPKQVPAKIKAGWVWRKLVPGFGTAGGAGSYRRALVSPDGVVAFVSDRAPGIELLDTLPELLVDYHLVALEVPYEQRTEASARGAVWIGHKKVWACAPDRSIDFSQWISGEPLIFDLMSD